MQVRTVDNRLLEVSQFGVGKAGPEPCPVQIEAAKAYLVTCQVTRRPKVGSYGVKWRAEQFTGTYIGAGAIIVAAVELGLPIAWTGAYNPNVLFAIKERKCIATGLPIS